MLSQISQQIKKLLMAFPKEEKVLFNSRLIEINKKNFEKIEEKKGENLAFVDGGQAEIISCGNFCLSFIRVLGVVFEGNKRKEFLKNEFYLLTRARYIEGALLYESQIFPLADKLIEEKNLLIDSNDATIRQGAERAAISKVADMARRFAELSLASQIKADFVVLDGTLEKTFKNEENFLAKLPEKAGALAKSSHLFTASGNSPVVLLNKIGPAGSWSYFLEGKTYFAKLQEKAKHVFRFEGNKEVLPYLAENSQDAVFLGYPYGLVLADRMARVSKAESSSLKARLLADKENKLVLDYLMTTDAHSLLDRIS